MLPPTRLQWTTYRSYLSQVLLKKLLNTRILLGTLFHKEIPGTRFWEHLIGLTKQAMKETLGRAFVTLPKLETVIVEIEANAE